MDYGIELKIMRTRRDVTQGQVAKVAGLNIHTVVDIESDRIEITGDAFRRLADAVDKASSDASEPDIARA